MEVEYYGFIVGEQRLELLSTEAVRMVCLLDQLEEVDDVNEADFEIWQMLSKKSSCGQGLFRDDIATRCHYDVWLCTLVVRGPLPNTDAFGAMAYGVLHIQILEMVLLICHDHIDVIFRTQAVVSNRE